MSASELSKRHGDDTAGLRTRYNQLCAALTALAGSNSKAADRVLQELQTLAQTIAFRQAEIANGDRAPAAAPPADAAAKPPRTGNVIAFRCKVRGVSQEHPRPSVALAAAPEPGPAQVRPDAAPAARQPLFDTIARQNAEIDRLARRSDEQADAMERFERQLGTSGPLSTLSIQVAALRAATQRQGQQMVSLATSVHRLAKLLAAQVPTDTHR